MSLGFGQVPTNATAGIALFKVSIPDRSLEELHTLLSLSKLAPVTYEGLQQDRKYGITREWLEQAKSFWLNDFDWFVQLRSSAHTSSLI
jgi:microsomal epoxide hydrolase